MTVDQRLLAVPREVAARLAGLSPARADYWARTEVAPPTTDETLANGRRVRLYEFLDLLALLVAAELRGRGVSLQHIRALVAHLRDLRFDNPLTELRFATPGRQVYIQYPDGTWSGGVRPEQLVFHQWSALVEPSSRPELGAVLESAQDAAEKARRNADTEVEAIRARAERTAALITRRERRFAERTRQAHTALGALRSQVGLLEQVQQVEQQLAALHPDTAVAGDPDGDHAGAEQGVAAAATGAGR